MTTTLANFVYFTIPEITTQINSNGEEKKQLRDMPKAWTTAITKDNYKNYIKSYHKAFCLPAGEINNITIIDFDDKSSYEYVLNLHPELKNYKTIQTRRGFHIYCKYNPNLHTQTNCLNSISGVDIANDKHMVFAPPTSYYTKDGVLNKYVDLGGEILDIPEFIIQDYKYTSNTKTKTKKIVVKDETETDTESVSVNTDNENMSDIEYLLMECIKGKFCDKGSQPSWSNIGQAIKNELKDEGVILFVKWTTEYGTENKKAEAFNHYTKYLKYTPLKNKDRLSMASLHFWAKKENETAYNLRFKKQIETTIDFDSDMLDIIFEAGDNDYGKYFVKKYGKNFVCTDIDKKMFYEFNEKNLWIETKCGSNIRNMISNEMYNDFSTLQKSFIEQAKNYHPTSEEYEKCNRTVKKISEICIKLKKTTDKNNILKEIMDNIINPTFGDDMNKEKYVLPIKNNKMLNMKTLETYDRTIKNKFNYECDAEYIELSAEQEKDINQYFLDLFCQKQDMVDCVMDILKSIFTGETLRYIYFFTGSGSNGKSLLFKILRNIFKKSMDTIDPSVIIDKKMNNQISTQFEKLDKCRLGYITELKESEKLHETNIKKISGGDEIDLRGLFKTNITINPTTNLCVLTNELPHFDKEDAIVNRIIVVPFLNTFEIDLSFETTMLQKKDFIFSYIMKKGVIKDKFNLTEDMIASKEEYVDANEKVDYLESYISEFCEIVEYDETDKTRIMRDDFRIGYNTWCKTKDFPVDKIDDHKFTRKMSKLNIKNKQVSKKKKACYIGICYKNEDCESESDD